MINNNPADFLHLRSEDITRTNLIHWFAFNETDKRLFEPNTIIKLDSKLLEADTDNPILQFRNYNQIKNTDTTLGRIVTNLALYDIQYEEDGKSVNCLNLVDFINAPFDKKNLKKADSQIAGLFTFSFISTEVASAFAKHYIDAANWLGFGTSTFLCPSLDYKTLVPSHEFKKLKAAKFKRDDIDGIIANNDAKKFADLEEELLTDAKADLERTGAEGYLFYKSGHKGNFA